MKIKLFFLAAIFSISLACNAIVPTNQPQTFPQSALAIGFDFSNQTPTSPEGDLAAPTHIFIHKYPTPSDGFVTGITILNDTDSLEEDFTLLILRPIGGGWKVIHHVNSSKDDQPSLENGIINIPFEVSLAVEKGDIFGHWQLNDTGSIPLNDEGSSFEGLSFGKFGITSKEIEKGQVILNENFSGGRDYFINLIFEEAP